ncbi:MAG: helix-hairpin-helix domain-containing protein [Candidatus Xenobia bacterium]
MQSERPGLDYRILNFLLACVGGAVAVWIAITMPQHASGAPAVTLSVLPPQPVTVSLRGAVAKPGIYRLPPQTRLYELLQQAGGALPGADTSALNLARRVHDEEMIVVPVQGAAPPAPVADSRVDVNTATADDLAQVPGLSDALAQRIVEYRTRYGALRTLDELRQIPGLKRRYRKAARHLKV